MRLGAWLCMVWALWPLASSARAPKPNVGLRRTVSYAELRRGFSQPSLIYAPYAFWFWDAPPDPKRAADVAAEMCRQGFMPGYAHPRSGMPRNQWLTTEWFDAVDAALRAVERAGGFMGYTDEYDWPSGQAAGRVLAQRPELRAQSLNWQTFDAADGGAVSVPACLFATAAALDPSGLIRSSTLRVIGGGQAFSWTAPPGPWRVFAFSTYHHPGLDGSPVNYLDPRVTETFIRIAHEPYARRFGDRLGKAMSGVFIDNEGDYGWKLAWSDHLDRTYRATRGRDIRLWMPLLVARDVEGVYARARWEWLDTVSDIYSREFFGRINRWCADLGMSCTMHVWEESLQLQAEAVGDYFKVMRAMSMPGTDSLIRKPLECWEFKETQSVSEFEGRRFCSEVLGVVGWDMPPALLKQTTNAVTAWGVSHVMPHGVYMRPDLNTIPYPPDFFRVNPYWPYLQQWTDFTRRASYVTSHGHTVPDVLLLNPMDSLWATVGEWLFAPTAEEAARIAHINDTYMGAIRTLTEARIEFLIADRFYVRKMTLGRDGRLTVGPFSFRAVVVPPVSVLPLDVMRKLVAFARAGGRIYVLGTLPDGSTDRGMGDPEMARLVGELRSQGTLVDCRAGLSSELARPGTALVSRIRFESGAFPMLQSHRRIDGRDFFWLANQSDTERECVLLIRGARGAASIWDCETGSIRPVASADTPGGVRVRLRFRPLEAFFLTLDPKSPAQTAHVRPVERWSTIPVRGPWRIGIDPARQPSVATDVRPLFMVPKRARALEASGGGRYVHDFTLTSKPRAAAVWVTADPGFRLYVNGKTVARRAADDVWRQARRIDLAPLLRGGANRIAASVPTTNAGWFLLQGEVQCADGKTVRLDTGDGWGRSTPESGELEPVGSWIWSAETRPNQTVWARRAFDLPTDAAIRTAVASLSADNRFTLWINGKRIGSHEPWMELASFDIRGALRPGHNTAAVEASNDDGLAGLAAGIHIGFENGRTARILSDTSWRVTDQPEPAWMEPAFDDRHWHPATRVAAYGAGPWGRFETATGIAPEWTWTAVSGPAWTRATVVDRLPDDVPSAMLRAQVRSLDGWLRWGLDRFTGYVDYRTTFHAPSRGRAILDLGSVKYTAEVFVNGKRVGARLWGPFEFDVSPYVRPGRNELRVRVGNLAVNVMAQFADRGILGTWGWGPPPARESYDAGLFGPVAIKVSSGAQGQAAVSRGRRARYASGIRVSAREAGERPARGEMIE